MPSSQVWRKALIRTGSAVKSSSVPSLMSRLLTKGWKLEPYGCDRRVDVDRLHLAGHALLLQEQIHHQEQIPRDEAVDPAVLVLVSLDGLAQRPFLHFEERRLPHRLTVSLAHRFWKSARLDPRTWSDTVGTSKKVYWALPAQTSCGSRCGWQA